MAFGDSTSAYEWGMAHANIHESLMCTNAEQCACV